MEREVILTLWLESIDFQSLPFITTTVKIVTRLGEKKAFGELFR